jgi:hypothetical protein
MDAFPFGVRSLANEHRQSGRTDGKIKAHGRRPHLPECVILLKRHGEGTADAPATWDRRRSAS